MSTTTEAVQVTKPRSVNVLMDLDTYQGMTDEEIDSIIEFKARLKSIDIRNTAVVNHVTEVANEMMESHNDNMHTLLSMVDEVRNTTPVMQRIESEV